MGLSSNVRLQLFWTPKLLLAVASFASMLHLEDSDKPGFFFFQAEDGIRDKLVTGVQTCALPICQGGIVGSSRRAARARCEWAAGSTSSTPVLIHCTIRWK